MERLENLKRKIMSIFLEFEKKYEYCTYSQAKTETLFNQKIIPTTL